MIESFYWKEELVRISRTIHPKKRPVRWSERAHCVVERDLMLGFFMVRRLIELHKVSSATRDLQLHVFSCPSLGRPIHRMNGPQIDEVYDLATERPETRKPASIANQFIHAVTSYVVRDESRNWSHIYVVSDFDRNDLLWRVPISEVRRLFLTAAQDEVTSMRMAYNAKTGDYDVTTN